MPQNLVEPSRMAASGFWSPHWKTRSTAWWMWALLAALLAAAIVGSNEAHLTAFLITLIQAAVYLARHRRWSHFPTQVRVSYAIWMAASFLPGLEPMSWVQMMGTMALVTAGYCPLARMLLFLPANRSAPLSLKRVLRIIFHPPTTGSAREELEV